MARENNFLLGQGEKLSHPVEVPSGGGPKNPPYSFGSAQGRIAGKLAIVKRDLAALPADACPRDEAVTLVTMHPRYISKSDYPKELLGAVGLRAVGSRSRPVHPEAWGLENPPETAVTTELFVAGPRNAFVSWADDLPRWTENNRGAGQLAHIENISAFQATDKLKTIPKDSLKVMLEVVLHNAGDDVIVRTFADYARRHGAEPFMERRRDVHGLTFVPVRVDAERVEDLARFAFLRVARGMPSLRPFRPNLVRKTGADFPVQLPRGGPLDESFRAVIFDGGIPPSARLDLANWVTLVEPPGIGPAEQAFEAHGLGVTSALLFGSLRKGAPPSQPICPIDHVRVLDHHRGSELDLEYVDVLGRILKHLDANEGRYRFINISLGPNLPVDDDEVTAWTAALDDRFVDGHAVVTVAAGNDGERDQAAGLCRVQPPADGVNVLAVGAADRASTPWQRANYSCTGPGRSPGVVKPDGLAFGGSDDEQFMVLRPSPSPVATGTSGTSFAAPLALRSVTAVRARLGEALGPLALRALMIHRADLNQQKQTEVGWGRFLEDPNELITCEDDEALVVFQGWLQPSQELRAPVPVPDAPLEGMVDISATLVFGPEIDPEHPAAYTRSGLEVTFRPDSRKLRQREDGTFSEHAVTKPFFSVNNMYGVPEYASREDGHKWEPCLRATKSLRATSLHEPSFDIYYNHRESASAARNPPDIPYALIVGLKARRVTDLYSQVVRTYANILVPIKPVLRVPRLRP